MNELLSVSLNLTPEECCKNEDLLKKIDELLLTAGMRYSRHHEPVCAGGSSEARSDSISGRRITAEYRLAERAF